MTMMEISIIIIPILRSFDSDFDCCVDGKTSGVGENGVFGFDTSHTWVDKCYKNDVECLEVDFAC